MVFTDPFSEVAAVLAVAAAIGALAFWLRQPLIIAFIFAGQTVGIREVEEQIWLVSFLNYDLGFFDKDEGRVEPAPNPFVPDKVLTMCPE